MPTAKQTSQKKAAVKKPAAKRTVKKSTPKKSVSNVQKKKKHAKVLVEADSAHCFWTTDGQILKDLVELESALRTMSERVYTYHATKERNDFADWVEQVLQNTACAAAIRKSKKPKSAATVVVKYLRTYM